MSDVQQAAERLQSGGEPGVVYYGPCQYKAADVDTVCKYVIATRAKLTAILDAMEPEKIFTELVDEATAKSMLMMVRDRLRKLVDRQSEPQENER